MSGGSRNSSNLPRPRFDPYQYTSGKWLRRDAVEHKHRRLTFDFDGLCHRVKAVSGFQGDITACTKTEGAFNRVFFFTFECGGEVVARLPTSVAGPARLTTNSEVATLEYLRANTEIPVPKVLDWSDDPQNCIQAEYIIMEKVPGVQLIRQWEAMTGKQHMLCIKSIAKMVKEMAKLKFPAYGSLYFAKAPLGTNTTIPIDEHFCIGPNCSSVFWNSAAGEYELYRNRGSDHGPWISLQELSNGLVASAKSRLPAVPFDQRLYPPYQGSVEEHQSLIATSQKVLSLLSKNERLQGVTSAMLMHPDLNRRNIFVSETDPTQITGLIDWQSTCSMPTFMYGAQIPDFAMLPEQVVEEHDEDDEAPLLDAKMRKDMTLCHDAFEVLLKGYCPTFAKARLLDYNFVRLFHDCNTSWRDSAAALRGDLMDIRDSWKTMGLFGDCPYQPSVTEIERHKKQDEDVEVSQALKSQVMQNLGANEDGWVPLSAWEEVLPLYKGLYNEWLDSVRDTGDMSLEKAIELWPFDPPDVVSHGRNELK